MINLEISEEELLKNIPSQIHNFQFIGLIESEKLTSKFKNDLLLACGSHCITLCAIKDIRNNTFYLGRLQGLWDYFYMRDIREDFKPGIIGYNLVELNIFNNSISDGLLGINIIKAHDLEFTVILEDSNIKLELV